MRTLFLWITTALYSQFGMNLTHAQENDYVVMQTNQTLTLLAIRCKTDSKIILEEITTPYQTLPSSWASWIDANARPYLLDPHRNRSKLYSSFAMLFLYQIGLDPNHPRRKSSPHPFNPPPFKSASLTAKKNWSSPTRWGKRLSLRLETPSRL